MVCEWNLINGTYSTWNTTCKHWIYREGSPVNDGWVYCPYCGDIIKEIELPSEEE